MVRTTCLDDETVTAYLAGNLGTPMRAAAEQHLVSCDGCRGRLVQYMRILEEDVQEDEESDVRGAIEQWARHEIPVVQRKTVSVKLLAFAASLMIAATLGLFVVLDRPEVPEPGEIIELVLSTDRPFQSRLSQQPYRPLFAIRGADQPSLAMDPLEAEMLRQAASDHLLGTFYLLSKDFDQAIEYLGRAAEGIDGDPSVHNDLGVAYLEKGWTSFEERAANYARARQQFESALLRNPQLSPAVYNLTLLYVRQDLGAEARASGVRYLEMDPESEWADEIRGMADLN